MLICYAAVHSFHLNFVYFCIAIVLAIILVMAIYGNSDSGLKHGTIEIREPTRQPSFVIIDGEVTSGITFAMVNIVL